MAYVRGHRRRTLSGQAVHFKHFAPEPKDYAVDRYLFEAKRQHSILDGRLSERRYVLGEIYTVWTWQCGGGLAWCRSSWARMPGVACQI